MADLALEETTIDLARDCLESERPAELPLFDAQGAHLLEQIKRGDRTRRENDQFLGLGGDGALALLTPAIIAMSWAAVDFLAEVARSVLKDALKDRVTAWLARDRSAGPLELPPELRESLRAALAAEFSRRFPGAEPGDLVERVLAKVAPPPAGGD